MSVFRIRRNCDRGHANYGWLNTYHTFSFARYYDPQFNGYGPLRVINEDTIYGKNGFGMHPHANYEIFSYVLSGALVHRDSMGNSEVIKRGGVQFTSAGTGIFHSEFNNNPDVPVHFLQVWIRPATMDLEPTYTTSSWTDEQKKNRLCRILSQNGKDSSIIINCDVEVFASILEENKSIEYSLGPGRIGYLHLADTGGKLKIRNRASSDETVELSGGDGVFISPGAALEIIGGSQEGQSEFLFFDMNESQRQLCRESSDSDDSF